MESIVLWGHWSNRKKRKEGNEYGKLFGSHEFPDNWIKKVRNPMIYIYRDGRDVAYSVWKTPNFINPKHKGITFEKFLDLKIDWEGTPAKRAQPRENIIEHWERHVQHWNSVKKKRLLVIRYENLVNDPEKVYKIILKKFFPLFYLFYILHFFRRKIKIIDKPVGLKPNMAEAQSWEKNLSKNEKAIILNKIKNKDLLYGQ